jgi:hypothetical protein
MHFFPKIAFPSSLACFQQAPNIDIWLVLSHLSPMCFVDLLDDHLELLHELPCLCLGVHNLFLECIPYLHCNILVDHPCKFFSGLCHVFFCFLYLCNDLGYSLLARFHLSLALLLMRLRSYEFCLQFLHVLCPFDALFD